MTTRTQRAAREPHRPWRQRLLLVAAALAVLRAVQAAVAALTVLAVTALELERPAPRLHLARLGEVEPRPLTPPTALVMLAVSTACCVLLLRGRGIASAFAGVKAFALVAAATIAGCLAAGPMGTRLVVAGCGASLVVLLWPAVRTAAVRVLTAIGLPHTDGRIADVALALKIAVLTALVLAP
ncbi:histidine kinase [Frankia canadensis]|nr:histidine kinase [Frankia canadensis]